MTLSNQEYDGIIGDTTKAIDDDIAWQGPPHSPTREFRVDIGTEAEYPIFVKGWYNAASGKLSYSIIHKSVGRIYGLDLGADHVNPDGRRVGEKHKNYWVSGSRDKWAYVPEEITQPWNRPVDVWNQFCVEARLRHIGTMLAPIVQRTFL